MSTRGTIAEIFDRTLPMPPVSGPPLPEAFRIRWPTKVRYNMPGVVQQVDRVYLNAKNKVSSTMRGF